MKMAHLLPLLCLHTWYLGIFVLIWGHGGECLYFTAVFVTKLLLPVGLGGRKKNGGLTSGQSCNFRQVFIPLFYTLPASFLCFFIMEHDLKDGP